MVDMGELLEEIREMPDWGICSVLQINRYWAWPIEKACIRSDSSSGMTMYEHDE